jgi:hypothetical protein
MCISEKDVTEIKNNIKELKSNKNLILLFDDAKCKLYFDNNDSSSMIYLYKSNCNDYTAIDNLFDISFDNMKDDEQKHIHITYLSDKTLYERISIEGYIKKMTMDLFFVSKPENISIDPKTLHFYTMKIYIENRVDMFIFYIFLSSPSERNINRMNIHKFKEHLCSFQ